MSKTKSWVNVETGEVIHNVSRIITEAQEEKIKNNVLLYKTIFNQYGEFFFYKYDELLYDIQWDTALAFRFLYVCTFADWNGCIYYDEDNKCAKESDFIMVFNKPKSTVSGFVDELIEHELVYQDTNGVYRVSEQYFAKKLSDNDFKNRSIRAFHKSIRELYRKVSARQHALVGELLKLVPFINIHTNALCKNINEADPNYINPLNKQDIQDIFRDGSDYGRKIYTKLEKLMIHGEAVIAKFTTVDHSHYVVNPRIFYRGNNINDLKALTKQFDIATSMAKKRRMKKYVQ